MASTTNSTRTTCADSRNGALHRGLTKAWIPGAVFSYFGPARILLLIAYATLLGCAPESPRKSADATANSVSPSESRPAAGESSVNSPPVTPELPANADVRASADNTDSSSVPAESPALSNEVLEISFDEIQLPIQPDMVFRPFMLTERVKKLDGKRIRIHGYMLPDTRTKGITQFVMLKNLQCKFGPGGQADHLINVQMNEGLTARFREDPISVEGVLKINPFTGPDGNTWSIYDLACERVERYRPRR